jgi:hypothetical protein
MDALQTREIQEAISAADNALYHLDRAYDHLSSAGNWGIVDIIGGGLLTNLIKHSKMRNAEDEIEAARYALQRFSKELRDVSGYSSVRIDDFLTFADFFFDGFIADVIVQSKIKNAKVQCEEAIYRIKEIRRELASKI